MTEPNSETGNATSDSSGSNERNLAPDAFLERYRADFSAAEKRVAREFEPSAGALVSAVAVLAIIGGLSLPMSGNARGWDVLVFNSAAAEESIGLPVRVFVWLVLVFGAVASLLALLTRRWAFALIASAGSAVSIVFGMLSIWSRQTVGVTGVQTSGAGVGLYLSWGAAFVLTVAWVRIAWRRTELLRRAEEERRAETIRRESGTA